MGLTLIIGPSGSGKTYYATRQIAQTAADRIDRPVIYITPDQMTLKTEQTLMEAIGTNSLLGIRVLSFKRLAFSIFEEIGMPPLTPLDDVGKSMVLQRIAILHRDELTYFGRSVQQKGFIERLKMMMTEIIQYRLSEETLREMAERQAEGSILRAKLSDIALLWHYFTEYLGKDGEERLIASETLLDLLAEKLHESKLIASSEIYIDGFSGFTPQQYRIIEELIRTSREVSVMITMPKEAFEAQERYQDWRQIPRQLYFTAQKTASKLSEITRDNHFTRRIVVRDESQIRQAPEIAHAAKYLCKTLGEAWPMEAKRVRAFEADTKEAEVERVMAEIIKLTRDEGMSCRDIAVMTPMLEDYAHLIRREAALCHIPVFIDDKSDITLNPMVQWMEALMDLQTGGWKQSAFLALIKTGLTDLSREAVDALENLVMKENWNYRDRILSSLESFDEPLFLQLKEWDEAISRALVASDYTRAMLQLMERQSLSEKMAALTEQFTTENDLQMAAEYSRMDEEIRGMLGQLSEILGDVEVSFQEYAAMLRMGIAECRMGRVPASIDEVMVGNFTRSRLGECKALFLIGFQGGSFPVISHGGSLLTDSERSKVDNRPEIAQGDMENLMEQYYSLECAIGKAKEKVFFFSHRIDASGQALGESPIWKRLSRILGKNYLMEEDGGLMTSLPMLYARDMQSESAKVALGALAGTDTLQFEREMMQSGRGVRGEQEVLSPYVADKLMDPTKRQLSISQLEKYAQCPYRYYLYYGLGLREREKPEVRQLEDGTVLHDLLKETGVYLSEVLSEEEADAIVHDLAEKKKTEYGVYQTSGRFRYYWEKLQETAAWSLRILSRQASYSDFQHEAFEWSFSERPGDGRPVRIPLANGQVVTLQGVIDRVDLWSSEEERYIRIIDFKSGSTELDTTKMYAGLQIQLPVYLEAGRAAFHAKPAGFFYFHLVPTEVDYVSGEDADDRMAREMSANRLKGLYIDDPIVVTAMDHSVEEGTGLAVYAKLTKDGKLSKQIKQSITPEQFEQLQDFVHRKIAGMAGEIKRGCVDRSPVNISSGQNQDPCSTCEYRKACPYDPAIPGTKTRKLESVNQTEFWNRLEAEA